jgi:hypothetical protein
MNAITVNNGRLTDNDAAEITAAAAALPGGWVASREHPSQAPGETCMIVQRIK